MAITQQRVIRSPSCLVLGWGLRGTADRTAPFPVGSNPRLLTSYMNFIMIGLLLREALDRLCVRLNMYVVYRKVACWSSGLHMTRHTWTKWRVLMSFSKNLYDQISFREVQINYGFCISLLRVCIKNIFVILQTLWLFTCFQPRYRCSLIVILHSFDSVM